MFFTTVGRRDGCCEHEHETFIKAQECLVKHQTERRNKNKISDRVILEVESFQQLEDELEII
jgi:hypothetical protein